MQKRLSPRDEYLLQEKQRVKDSPPLQQKFQQLKGLIVEIAYKDSADRPRHGQMKYTVNVAHANSVFRVSCPNRECVEGDFDLSTELAAAIERHRDTVTGELTCPGWRSRTTIGQTPCHSILFYTLNIEYQGLAVVNETK